VLSAPLHETCARAAATKRLLRQTPNAEWEMRKIQWVWAVALLAAVVVGSWAIATKAKAPKAPEATAATMSPFDMMHKAINLPVHIIDDPI